MYDGSSGEEPVQLVAGSSGQTWEAIGGYDVMSPRKQTNETTKAITGIEKAFQAFTTSQLRYVRIFHTPYDLIQKAGLFDTLVERYIRKELSPTRIDNSPLVESCQRTNLKVTTR